MHNEPIPKASVKYKVYTHRKRFPIGEPVMPPPETETVLRGLQEHDAKAHAKGWTKSPKHPGRYKAIRCGHSWDVIRTE